MPPLCLGAGGSDEGILRVGWWGGGWDEDESILLFIEFSLRAFLRMSCTSTCELLCSWRCWVCPLYLGRT